MPKIADLKVFISTRDSTCDECKEQLARHVWITLDQDKTHCVWPAPTWITWHFYRPEMPA